MAWPESTDFGEPIEKPGLAKRGNCNRMSYVIDLRHFLDQKGEIPENIPGPALSIGLFFGSIVGWVTTHQERPKVRTNVPCRRSPGRRRCLGIVLAGFDSDGSTIIWQCPVCHDNGFIRGWENTLWDRRGV